jgi:FkbM family methyltransferase
VLARFFAWQVRKRVWKSPLLLHAFGGARLWCHPDNVITSSVIYLGWPDWAEMRFARDLLRPGDGFLDVGANVGVYSVLALTRVLPGGRLLAFEPEGSLFERLVQNLKLNNAPNESAKRVAIADREGTCFFTSGRDALGSIVDEGDGAVEVPMSSLDALVSEPQSFHVGKVDVEGHELPVFLGARRLLEAQHPKCWLIETNQAASRADRLKLQELLEEFGFHLYEFAAEGKCLRRIPRGGAFPANSVAICDPAWIRLRIPGIEIS